uniref:F-box domain-containing protein n=1 Tax=Mycena chlorophos TaxID=658473 RepID=A0ABQ0LW46_MYCCL|nr:predicted protein [Mycena chlorophos]
MPRVQSRPDYSLKCPAEILQTIFLGNSQVDLGSFHFGTNCSQVCRRWRDVAINTAELWSTIRVEGRANVLKVETFLTRARNRPLKIFIQTQITCLLQSPVLDRTDMINERDYLESGPRTTDNVHGLLPSFSPSTAALVMAFPARKRPSRLPLETPMGLSELAELLDILSAKWSQWRTIEFTAHRGPLLESFFYRLSTLPSAENHIFEMGVFYTGRSLLYDSTAQDQILFDGSFYPAFQRAVFQRVILDWAKSAPTMASLMILDIESHTVSYESLRDAVSGSRILTELAIRSFKPLGPRLEIILPCLESLTLTRLVDKDLADLFQALTVPILSKLDLEFGSLWIYERFLETIQTEKYLPMWSRLTHLTLTETKWNRPQALKVLNNLNLLESLSLRYCTKKNEFCATLMANPELCPKLVKLLIPDNIPYEKMIDYLDLRSFRGTSLQQLAFFGSDSDESREKAILLRRRVKRVDSYTLSISDEDID